MRPALRKAGFGFVAAVLGLVALEGLARAGIWLGLQVMLPADVRTWIESRQLVFDPELGWRPAAGFPTVEGGHFKPGVMGPNPPPAPPGGLRGYAFGDSQTHGAGVAETQAWPSFTEKALREGGLSASVVNLGSSGYRSAQVLRLIEAYVLPNHPDFLLVDCMVADSERLPRHYAAQWPALRSLLFESRIYRLASLGIAKARHQNTGPVGVVRIEQPEGAQGAGAGNHDAIVSLARSEHIPLLFVDYPFSGTPIRSLAPAAQLPAGVPVVEATAALNADGRPSDVLFLENNHLSAAGGEVVGRAVAAALRKELGK